MMQPEDYTLTPSGPLGGRVSVGIYAGPYVGEFDTIEDALNAICRKMDREQFWPSIWWISDHGDFWQIDFEGNEIKTEEEDPRATVDRLFSECDDHDDWEAIVKSPGKFEGEAAYVPYFWDVYMNGLADGDDGEGLLRFDVTDEDRQRFPDLSGVDFVELEETDSGFVVEV